MGCGKQNDRRMRREYVIKRLETYSTDKNKLNKMKAARNTLIFRMGRLHTANLEENSKMRAQIDVLTQKLQEIQAKTDRIDCAIARLNMTERTVIKAKYMDIPNGQCRKKSFRVLAWETQYAEGTLKNAQTSAIKKLEGLL